MPQVPNYSFNEFKKACENNEVIPINTVLSDAEKCFNLKTINEILSFIANDGLENLKFINSTTWKNNKSTVEIIVDAYEFTTADILGYIAFMFSPKTNKWIIKSFHFSENSNPVLREALKKAGLLCEPRKLLEENKNGN